MGYRDPFLSNRRTGLVVKINTSQMYYPVSRDDLLAGLAIPVPRALMAVVFSKTTGLPPNHSVLAMKMKIWELCLVQNLPQTRCQDTYASG
jgi:hypothetical protein